MRLLKAHKPPSNRQQGRAALAGFLRRPNTPLGATYPQLHGRTTSTTSSPSRPTIRRSVAHRSLVEEFIAEHGSPTERSARYVALFGSMFAIFVVLPLLTVLLGLLGTVFGLLIPIWFLVRNERFLGKVRLRIVTNRLCVKCAYSLLHTPTDCQGNGVCPECGHAFNEGVYRPRPPT